MAKETMSWRSEAPWVDLGWRAVSPEAHALVAYCFETLVSPSLPERQKGAASLLGIKTALEGLLGGLISLRGANWGRRPLGVVSFTKEPVSHTQFKKVFARLEEAGLIERMGGRYDGSGAAPQGLDTRVRLSETGRTLVEAHGITDGSTHHFGKAEIGVATESRG